MFRKVLLVLFFLFAIIYTFDFGVRDHEFVIVFKLIPMVLLIIYAAAAKAFSTKAYYILMTIGLFVCAIGDYTISKWFVIGLAFFLLGHLFYISAFLSTKQKKAPLFVLAILLIYGLTMFFIIPFNLLQDGDHVMGIAVTAYILVILTMGWTSWRTNNRFAILGAILFIISDSILALNKFTLEVPSSGMLIMGTYYAAQLLFALSISQYSENRNKMIQ